MLPVKLATMVLLVAAILAAGCGSTTLVPAPEANRLAAHAAFAKADGVRLTARAEAWNGVPLGLTHEVTPLLVTIMNGSDGEVRVAYAGLALVAPDGRVYRALEPRRIGGIVTEPIPDAPYPPLAFRGTWPHPAPWTTLGPSLRYVRLPTLDMLRQALPEGVVQPGGQVSGFVYFERVPPHKGRIDLRARFVQPGGEHITRVEIPFDAG